MTTCNNNNRILNPEPEKNDEILQNKKKTKTKECRLSNTKKTYHPPIGSAKRQRGIYIFFLSFSKYVRASLFFKRTKI